MNCKHAHTTLCGRFDPDAAYYVGDALQVGMFVAWQCDECGAILRDEVDADDLYRNDLPALDFEAHMATIRAATNRAFPQATEMTTLQFLAGAIR